MKMKIVGGKMVVLDSRGLSVPYDPEWPYVVAMVVFARNNVARSVS
jgi:hypothetical protein